MALPKVKEDYSNNESQIKGDIEAVLSEMKAALSVRYLYYVARSYRKSRTRY